VTIYERTPVLSFRGGGGGGADRGGRVDSGRVTTTCGTVRAPVVVLATEPLGEDVWTEIGWSGRGTFTDGRHLIIYASRTEDDRIALGGRGAPYHFGSAISNRFECEPKVFDAIHRVITELFPATRGARITHRWGGPIGIPRDWYPGVTYDGATGLGWAGGYVGDGVATTNLAGRTLADLILGRDSAIVRLPWVQHRSRPWEPEPFRWLGANFATRMMAADEEERRSGRPYPRSHHRHLRQGALRAPPGRARRVGANRRRSRCGRSRRLPDFVRKGCLGRDSATALSDACIHEGFGLCAAASDRSGQDALASGKEKR